MRIYLALQHLVFQIFFLLLVLQASVHQKIYIFGQIIDSPADISQLVIPFDGGISGEISRGYPLHPVVYLCDRYADHPVQHEHQKHTDAQNTDDDSTYNAPEEQLLIAEFCMGNNLADIAVRHFQRSCYHNAVRSLAVSYFVNSDTVNHCRGT